MPTSFAVECWLAEVDGASSPSRPLKRRHDADAVALPIALDSHLSSPRDRHSPSPPSKRRRVLAPLSRPRNNEANVARRLMSGPPSKGKRGRDVAHGRDGAEEEDVHRRTSPRRREGRLGQAQHRAENERDSCPLQQPGEGQDQTPRAPRARGGSRGSGTGIDRGSSSESPTPRRDPRVESFSTTNLSLRDAPAPNWPPLGHPAQPTSWPAALSEGGDRVSSRASTSTASSARSERSKRSASPSKTAVDLVSAGIFLEPLRKDKLSPYTQGLYLEVLAASQDVGIVPAALEGMLNGLLDGELMPHNLARNPRQGSEPTAEQLAQLSQLQSILAAAVRCSINGSSESGWNVKVHGPLLQLAIGEPDTTGVDFESLTHAHISKSFLPSSASGVMSSRLVDLALVLSPAPRSLFHHAMIELLAAASTYAENVECVDAQAVKDERSISQSLHQPLMHQPISVSIETKLERKAEDGVAQLGIWSAAGLGRWRRLGGIARALRQARDGGSAARFNRYKPIEMPLLRTTGHYWFLLFAKDCSDEVPEQGQTLILTEIAVGNTNSLLGLFRLFRVLRLLAGWTSGTFRTWIAREILGIAEEACG